MSTLHAYEVPTMRRLYLEISADSAGILPDSSKSLGRVEDFSVGE
jgi:hypothetical protein